MSSVPLGSSSAFLWSQVSTSSVVWAFFTQSTQGPWPSCYLTHTTVLMTSVKAEGQDFSHSQGLRYRCLVKSGGVPFLWHKCFIYKNSEINFSVPTHHKWMLEGTGKQILWTSKCKHYCSLKHKELRWVKAPVWHSGKVFAVTHKNPLCRCRCSDVHSDALVNS